MTKPTQTRKSAMTTADKTVVLATSDTHDLDLLTRQKIIVLKRKIRREGLARAINEQRLIPEDQHREEISDVVSTLVTFLDTLPDRLERKMALPGALVLRLRVGVDQQRDILHAALVAHEDQPQAAAPVNKRRHKQPPTLATEVRTTSHTIDAAELDQLNPLKRERVLLLAAQIQRADAGLAHIERQLMREEQHREALRAIIQVMLSHMTKMPLALERDLALPGAVAHELSKAVAEETDRLRQRYDAWGHPCKGDSPRVSMYQLALGKHDRRGRVATPRNKG